MVISQLVAEAPAAELASGDADVSTTGNVPPVLVLWSCHRQLAEDV